MDVNMQNKPKRHKRGKSKISFDAEDFTKDYAKKLVSQEREISVVEKQPESSKSVKQLNKRKRNKELSHPDDPQNEDHNETNISLKKKQISRKHSSHDDTQQMHLDTEEPDKSEVSQETSQNNKKESNRAVKRKKHAKLVEDKKVKLELDLQQKALNYLSKWKHSKSAWKFEKLRQVWLQQNLFDKSKVPDEFWDTTVEYFSGAKGYSRQAILDIAIKHIENEKSSDGSTEEDFQIKLKRARDIVQYLE